MTSIFDAARHGALVVAEPELGSLVATGPDRASWLNGIVSCDVTKVGPGVGQWGLALTKTGKIVSELFVIAGEGALYVATAPGVASELVQSFDRMLVMEDAEIGDRSAELGFVRVHGPRAAELAQAVAERFEASWGAIDWTGLGGALIVVRRERSDELVRALVQAGGQGVVSASRDDWERLRIARGVPRFGVDFTAADNPHEASLEQRAVNWSKGCYLGQEVVCMQDMRGKVKRRVVALELEGAEPPPAGASVEHDGQAVGEVTSTARGELGRAVALARIRTPFDEPGAALSIGGRTATVRTDKS